MAYIEKERLAKVKQVDLLTYLQVNEPQELVRLSENVYTTRTHDSLKISNGKWCWWSRDIGGRSALDYLIKVKRMNLPQAVEQIEEGMNRLPFFKGEPIRFSAPKKAFELPKSYPNHDRVISYLQGRGIDKTLLHYCISTGRLYESSPHHNAVFVGLDEKENARYATMRGITEKRFIRDVEGSDKRYCFTLPAHPSSPIVHVFESSIDLLSLATLHQWNPEKCENYLSLGGIYSAKRGQEPTLPIALRSYLEKHQETELVMLHFDADEVGKQAAHTIQMQLSARYQVVSSPPPYGKDWNEYLCNQNTQSAKREREISKEMRRVEYAR